jgi:hypothetical protein
MFEEEFRNYQRSNGGPTWDRSTPEILEQLGCDPVFEGPQATGGTVYQYSQRQGVECIDGKWFTKYVLGPIFTDLPTVTASEQEQAYKSLKDLERATQVRVERTQRLKDSDWTQLADAPVNKTAWAVYRQSLRDVTIQPGFPWQIDWPNMPD